MKLIEQTQVPDEALPVAELRDHLQLGSGFADDGFQDSVLLTQLRAALAVVEAETGKAVLRRSFLYTITAWRDLAHEFLPIAPVSSIASFSVVDQAGGVQLVPASGYRLIEDTHRPELRWLGLVLPTIPVGGRAELVFEAGYGAAWGGVPADLRQAVLMVSGHLYENRTGRMPDGLPAGVAALLKPFKPMRLFGGARR